MVISEQERTVLLTASYGLTREEIEAELLSRSLREFVRAAWHVVQPEIALEWSPYIDALCDHLQAVTETAEEGLRGGRRTETSPVDVRNLLINIPPRTLKSTICSVLWPVWMWTRTPGMRILSSSYGKDLAERDSVRSRWLIQHPWFQKRWGKTVQLRSDQNRRDRYDNTLGGYRLALGKFGAATGEGGDILISDDPQNVTESYSPSALAQTISWFGDVWSNRKNHPKLSCMVVIQQRIHDNDLSGTLSKNPAWVHLKLPMEYEGEKNRTAIGWEDWREEEGEWLLPSRYAEAERDETIATAGDMGYATQYQQRPVKRGGAILKDAAWVRYIRSQLPERFRRVAAFADTAEKAKEQNDYSAIALWGEDDEAWWLLDLVWGKWEFPELEEKVIESWNRWKLLPLVYRPRRLVVEEASSGTQLVQTLKKRTKLPVVGYNPPGDKVVRANMTAVYQQNGKLRIPAKDDDGLGVFDVADFIREHSMFPNTLHDDRVDTTTAMLHYWEIAPPDDPEPFVLSQSVAHRRLG